MSASDIIVTKFMKKNVLIPMWVIYSVIAVVLVAIIVVVISKSGSSKTVVRQGPVYQPMANFSVGSNGDTRISGVVITAINSGTITATSTINKIPTTFTINTDRKTVVHKLNATSTLSKLSVGDVLTVAGTIQDLNPNLTLLAKDIRSVGYYGGPQVPKPTTTKK